MQEGVFWVVCDSADDFSNGTELPLIFCHIPHNIPHEEVWEQMSRANAVPRGKCYNYYPRGRVVIANGKAKIFLNRNISHESIIRLVAKSFELPEAAVFVDGSRHYDCFLDKPGDEVTY
jgi:hypothetical protein